MKILCVIDSLGSGGAQRQLTEMAVGFAERGHCVSFLTYHSTNFFINRLDEKSIRIDTIVEKKYLKRFLKMRKFIRSNSFDIVVSFLEAPVFICELAGLPHRRWKLIVGERSADSKIHSSLKLKIFRWFHFLADYVVSNSYANMQMVKEVNPLLPFKKCKVIYNLIDFNMWACSKKEYRLNQKFKIIVAASHGHNKNLNGLLGALILLSPEEINELKIEWYGDNIQEPYFDDSFCIAKEKIIKNHLEGVISFFPATHSIAEIIKSADCVGLFSLNEGLPNIICEAMTFGKPVICSEVSDIPRILNYNKNILFNPQDPYSICDTLRYMINLNNEELGIMGDKNREIALNLFSKEKNINKYLELMTN